MPDPVAAHGPRTTALRLSSAIGKLGLHGKIEKVFADSRDGPGTLVGQASACLLYHFPINAIWLGLLFVCRLTWQAEADPTVIKAVNCRTAANWLSQSRHQAQRLAAA